MQVMMRRLLVITAISLGGGLSGLALGNFVAGSERPSGAEELAAFAPPIAFEDATVADEPVFSNPVSPARNGPTSYDCKGCDAGLHARDDVVDLSPVEPLPPYDPYAQTEPPTRTSQAGRSARAREDERAASPDARLGSAPLIVE